MLFFCVFDIEKHIKEILYALLFHFKNGVKLK